MAYCKVYMVYRPEDFSLYLFSLLVFGLISLVALHNFWQLLIIFLMLFYLLIFFMIRHGVKLNFSSLLLIIKESFFYPIVFLRELIPSLGALLPLYASFIAALLVEGLVYPSVEGTFLVNSFPYMIIFYIEFIVLNLFRTFILVAHLKKHAHVHSFLNSSVWKSQIKKIHIRYYILHAYFTGVLADLAIVLPSLVFWYLTSPTYLREFLLIIFYVMFQYNSPSLKNATNITNPSKTSLSSWVDISSSFASWFRSNHEHAHKSRFYFTVFHGHHHDAIPSSLIASTGVGLLEGVHRGLVRLNFLYSTTILLIFKLPISNFFDMILHQYIPGVYPYSASAVTLPNHHAVHHYFSILPLAIGQMPYLKKDIEKGYDPANKKARWFIKIVSEYENLDPHITVAYCTILPEEPKNEIQNKPSRIQRLLRALFLYN